MADGWFIKRDAQKYGPYSSTQMVEMAKMGQVLPIDQVARGENGQWTPATQIKGLFAVPTQGSATQPQAPVARPSPPPADASAFAVESDEMATGSAGLRKQRATRLSKPLLAAIAGGLLVVILLVVVVIVFVSAKPTKDQSATVGTKRKGEERTMKSRTGGSDGGSYLEKAVRVTGVKANPSLKPAEPGSLQDFFDALGLMCVRMENARIRPGARISIFFDPPYEASKWHQVFGEPTQLPKGRERIGKVENEFDRWQHKCTDGTLIFQGQMMEGGGKIKYSPRNILVN